MANSSRKISLRFALLVYVGLSVVAFIWCWVRSGTLPFVHPAFEPPVTTAAIGNDIVLGIITAAFVIVSGKLLSSYLPWSIDLESAFAKLLGNLSVWAIFVLSLLSSFGEELFFRGVLQPLIGTLLSAVIFAVLHIGPTRKFLLWTAMAFLIGLLFGFYFERNGSLSAPITAHFLINFINLILIMRATHWNPQWQEPDDEAIFGESLAAPEEFEDSRELPPESQTPEDERSRSDFSDDAPADDTDKHDE